MKRDERERGFVCPRCGKSKIAVFYSAPLQYRCEICKVTLIDENAGPAIPVLSREEAESKRPALFGLLVCACCDPAVPNVSCTHAPHPPNACPWCIEEAKEAAPHVYKFRVAA